MATDHFEEDIDIEPELDDGDDLDLNVLDDDDEDVAFSGDDEVEFEADEAPADDDEDEEEDEESDDAAVSEGEATAEEDDDDDVVVEDDDDEEEDEETLEVLLGPDSETTVAPARSRKDESGDAPPGEGEFTCRSCFLVKRRAQLADADAMICLDCA